MKTDGPAMSAERYVVRWEQVRPAGTTLFAEIRRDREDALDFAKGLLVIHKADGVVYVDRQQRDAGGKWQTLDTLSQ